MSLELLKSIIYRVQEYNPIDDVKTVITYDSEVLDKINSGTEWNELQQDLLTLLIKIKDKAEEAIQPRHSMSSNKLNKGV